MPLVFAYYLTAFPTYSNAVADFKREIGEAQAVGIDGFAVQTGAWDSWSQSIVANLFEAARQLGNGFRLFLSPDIAGGGLTQSQIRSMIQAYVGHTSYFRSNNRPLLSCWMGESKGETFWHDLLRAGPLKAKNIFFVPYFYTDPQHGIWTDPATVNWNNPTYAQVASNWDGWWKNVADGLMYYAAPGFAEDHAATNAAMAQLMRDRGKAFIAGIAPHFYVGRVDPSRPELLRRYYDTHGGEGIATQWDAAIDGYRPDWLMIDNWNDFTETYISPADPAQMPWKQNFYNVGPIIRSHVGYAELCKHYIARLKGQTPATDAVFAFYRTHPKDAVVPDDNPQNIKTYGAEDNIYVTAILTAPATVRVSSGGVATDIAAPAGVSHHRLPFAAGAQSFDLIRDGVVIARRNGDPIEAAITLYNYATASCVVGQ